MESLHPVSAELPSSAQERKQPPSLLTIPGEIRNKIYDLLLIFDTVDAFNCAPCCSACPPREDIPYVPLLQVNRQINAEASALLYSTTTFHISTGRNLVRFMSKPEDHCLYTPAKDIFPTRTAIRSLEIKFLAEYIPTNYHEERLRELWKSQEFREQRRKSKAEYFHALDLSASKAVWLVAGKLLCLLNGLKVLTIDFELAFCPEGCCRVAEDVVKSLRKLLRRTDLELKVKGTLDDDEHRIITNALRARSKGSDASDDNTESDESSDDEANSDGDGSDDNSSSSSSDNDGDVEGED